MRLADVCEVNPSKPKRGTIAPSLPVTFVPMPAVDAESGSIASPSVRPYSEVSKGFTYFADGDVIMAKITPCMENGKAAIARRLTNGIGFGSTEFHVLRPAEQVLAEYVYYFIRQEAFRQAAEMEMTGSVGQKRVPADFIENAELPLPPLAEQKRIVEAIERLTARVDAARARLAAVPAILKRFRQAVLAAACSGRLTEEWRESRSGHANANDLLRHAETVRRQAGRVPRVEGAPHELDAPPAWTRVFFGNLLTLLTSGSRGWAEFYSTTGPLFVRSQDINTDRLVLDDVAHVTPPAHSADRARTRVQRHDVLLTITGANVTKCALVDTDVPEAYVSQHVALCRPALPSLAPFLHLWLTSPQHGRGVLLDVAYGAGKPGLNLDNIKEIPLALPTPEEQAEIVRRVESLMKLADTIERRVTAAQARADKLTQSVLARAFRGELVPAIEAKPEAVADLARAKSVVWRFEDFAAVQAEIVRRFPNDPTLGRKKLFKLTYLAAALCNAKTEKPLKRDAAGPYDGKLQADVESHAASQKWFTANKVARDAGEAHYRPGTLGTHASAACKALLADQWTRFDALLAASKSWDSKAAELHATTHAAWNALLAEGVEATPDAIANRFFEWSNEKAKKFSKWQVESACKALANMGITPTGRGPIIERESTAPLFGGMSL
ncbi:MAG: restriction endonuclease subunit S [Phycisphaerales bacterium]|nr:restriction endonuclease subunit S [Phycisphaerales bacterium]